MLTIFSIPKPFQGHNGIIQNNAIRSWKLLCPPCEIILLGDDEGTAEVAAELGLRHIPNIERNELGTPLVSSIFSTGQKLARYDIVGYVNADIILLSDFLPAIEQVPKRPFLLAGQRWDLDVTEPIDFTQPDWEARLRRRVAESGQLHAKTGIDFLIFPRGLFSDIPPFAIGRGGWDTWLVYRARRLSVPVIDATKAITAVHQNHDYSHIKRQGSSSGEEAASDPKGRERQRNTALRGGQDYGFTLEYATHLLDPGGLKAALTPRHLYFRLRAIPLLYPRWHPLLRLFKAFEKCAKVFRSRFRA